MDINGEKRIIKSSDLLEYFNKIIEKQNKNPIIKVYSKNFDCPDDTEERRYDIDTEFYILFENQNVLIIDYRNIDSLYIEYKKLSRDELEEAAKMDCGDFFNRTDEVYNYKTMKMSRRITSTFEYGYIKSIKYNKVNNEYEVWENSTTIAKKPNEETFDEIILVLDNNNEIHISPEPALSDGYVDIWCEGAKVYIKKYE